MYIGQIGEMITKTVTLRSIYNYTDRNFNYYGTEKFIYTMVFIRFRPAIRSPLQALVEKGMSKEEREEIKLQEQLKTIGSSDFLYLMPYRQYKEHYADCETLAKSFHYESGIAMITVIIRHGRLKNSGTRFKRYSEYKFKSQAGCRVIYRAINEENARKRVEKEFPNDQWELEEVFR